MTGNDVYIILRDARSFLSQESGGNIVFDPKSVPGFGFIHEDKNGFVRFMIGTYGLEGSRRPLSDHKAMLPIMALFHEVCGHGGQLKYEFSKDTDLSRVLALNNYACYSSGLYYDGNAPDGVFSEQYSKQPHEIAAQYMGLKCAQEYLPRVLRSMPSVMDRVFGKSVLSDEGAKQRTDKMLLSYVNYRVSINSEFVSRSESYTSMDDVYRDFEHRFMACYNMHREYDYKQDPYSPVGHQVSLYQSMMKRNGYANIGISNRQADLLCDKSVTGTHQDIMLCSAFSSDDPDEAVKLHKPALDHIDLSVGTAFQAKPPWRPPGFKLSAVEKMTNMIREIDRNNVRFDGISGPGPPGS